MSDKEKNEEKPLKDYIPKEITQQSEFLRRYPEYDGRGVLIAILDLGIDVSLPGLQKTTTDLPKIVDCIDFTGNGDIDTSTVKKMDANGILIGLTGRKLNIPKSWKNSSNEWHLGIKSVYELFAEEALEKICKSRKEFTSQKNQDLQDKFNLNLSKNSEVNDDSKFLEKYLKSTEDLLKESLVLDCIVWNDGIKWKAAIDTSFCGEVGNEKVLTNYKDEHEFGFMSDNVSYCLNIYENGNLLEIITPQHNHGTIVAQVAAAYFPYEPCGLAPGAQIVFMNIGGKEGHCCQKAHLRALQRCVEMGVDIINFSFGSPSNSCADFMKDISEKYGVIIVASGGNEGSCLSTTSYDKWTYFDLLFIIGAVVSSDMKKQLYEVSDASSSTAYNWSSRGPLKNSSIGITLTAPGAAITMLPRSFPKNNELNHGTRLSSPNACGNIACLITALRDNSIAISPFWLKIALTNTALSLERSNKLSVGHGIIQILSAFEFLKKFLNGIPKYLTNIGISVKNKENLFSAGIYIENSLSIPEENNGIKKITVNIQAEFAVSIVYDSKSYFKARVLLKISDNGAGFIDCPKSFDLPKEDSFDVEIDTTKLKPGMCHFAEISGIDVSNPSLGALFRVPITVIVPEKVEGNYTIKREIILEPEVPYRFLVKPPPNSHQCALSLTYYDETPVC